MVGDAISIDTNPPSMAQISFQLNNSLLLPSLFLSFLKLISIFQNMFLLESKFWTPNSSVWEDAFIIAIIWKKMFIMGWMAHIKSPNPVHLLWALSFMQTYVIEENTASPFGRVDEKTCRNGFGFTQTASPRLHQKWRVFDIFS